MQWPHAFDLQNTWTCAAVIGSSSLRASVDETREKVKAREREADARRQTKRSPDKDTESLSSYRRLCWRKSYLAKQRRCAGSLRSSIDKLQCKCMEFFLVRARCSLLVDMRRQKRLPAVRVANVSFRIDAYSLAWNWCVGMWLAYSAVARVPV